MSGDKYKSFVRQTTFILLVTQTYCDSGLQYNFTLFLKEKNYKNLENKATKIKLE